MLSKGFNVAKIWEVWTSDFPNYVTKGIDEVLDEVFGATKDDIYKNELVKLPKNDG